MKQDIRGFKIALKEGEKIARTKMSDEMVAQMEIDHKKYVQPETFLKKFIGENNYKKVDQHLRKLLEDSLPEGTKNGCKYCSGESDDDLDKNCLKYELQSLITFKLMAYEFVEIVRANQHLFNDKMKRFEITKEFFHSIKFYKNQGLMVFDMGRMMEKVLELGFLSVNQMLLQTSHLSQSLSVINHSINSLNDDIRPYKIKSEEIPEFYLLQRDFFKDKQDFYKEEQRLNREEKLLKAKKINSSENHTRPNRTDIAYFCYYTSESKELITENPFPSKKAWKEIGERFSKDATNIEKAYNKIAHKKDERLSFSKKSNINFVLENMLDDHPKAEKLMLEELKLTEIN